MDLTTQAERLNDGADAGKELAPFSFSRETENYVRLLEKIAQLEERIVRLESEQMRFTNALINAGEFIFKNPMSKMMMASFPKEVQNKLKEFFGGT